MCPRPRKTLLTQCVVMRTLLLSVALMALSLCSCAGFFPQNKSIQPWIENGVTQGTRTRTIAPFGYEYHYKDASRRLMRVEMYNRAGSLLPGACIIKYEYDDRDRLVKESLYNADRELVEGKSGYALKKTEFGNAEGNAVVTITFYSSDGTPVITADGYTQKETIHVGISEKLKHEFYSGPNGEACGVRCYGVNGVAHVEYDYLQGVGEVTCATFYGTDGQVLARKQVSGKIFEVTKH